MDPYSSSQRREGENEWVNMDAEKIYWLRIRDGGIDI